jgi:hypothetical protein
MTKKEMIELGTKLGVKLTEKMKVDSMKEALNAKLAELNAKATGTKVEAVVAPSGSSAKLDSKPVFRGYHPITGEPV